MFVIFYYRMNFLYIIAIFKFEYSMICMLYIYSNNDNNLDIFRLSSLESVRAWWLAYVHQHVANMKSCYTVPCPFLSSIRSILYFWNSIKSETSSVNVSKRILAWSMMCRSRKMVFIENQ